MKEDKDNQINELISLRKKLNETTESISILNNDIILKQTKSKIIEEEFSNILE